jgi:hypothetical protein
VNLKLQELFLEIETQRHSLLLPLKDLSSEKLNHHAPGKWSINQIIAHLITAENLSLRYLNKKILGIETVRNTGIAEELKMILLIISQRLPLKFKAPKMMLNQTLEEADINKLIDDWNKTRSDLKTLLDRIEDHHIKRKIYRHVVVGMLNIQHTLKFIGEHVGHHTPQIKKLTRK